MDLGGSCFRLLSDHCQSGNSLALMGSTAWSAKGSQSSMAAPGEALLLAAFWAKHHPTSLSDGGSKGIEVEAKFTPQIFKGKVSSVFQTYG